VRAVWSFWSAPFHAHHHRVWLSPRHHLLAWILSTESARRHYAPLVLHTDDAGARWACQARYPTAAPAGGKACAGGSTATCSWCSAATAADAADCRQAAGAAACYWRSPASATADAADGRHPAVTSTDGCETSAAAGTAVTSSGGCATSAAASPGGGRC